MNEDETLRAEEIVQKAKGTGNGQRRRNLTLIHFVDIIANAYIDSFCGSLPFASLIRVRAVRIPCHASRSILSSCKPRFFREELPSAGSPTPSDGGMKPEGGALIADGAIRECLICASEDLIAT